MEWKKKFNQQKMIVRYTLQYGLVMIATLLLSLVLVSYSLFQYRDELVNNTKERLHISMDALGNMLTEQKTLAKEIYLDQYTRPTYMLFDDYQRAEGVDQLRRLQGSLLLNDYIGLKYEEEWIYTQEGRSTQKVFTERTLELSESGKQVVEALFGARNEKERFAIVDSTAGEKYLFYLYPLSSKRTEENHVFFSIIELENLEEYLQTNTFGLDFYARICSEDGAEIGITGNIGEITDAKAKEMERFLETGREGLFRQYIADRYSLPGFEIQIVLMTQQIMAPFYNTLTVALIVILLVGAAVIAGQSIFNSRNVAEIYALKDKLLQYNDKYASSTEINELSLINNLVDQMYQEHSDKEARRENFYRDIKVQISNMLLDGLIENEVVLRQFVTQLFPQLLSPYYVVLGVLSPVLPREPMEQICNSEKILVYIPVTDNRIGEGAVFNNMTMITVIVGMESADEDGGYRRKLAEKIHKAVYEANGEDVVVATGKAYGNLRDIHHSYNEMNALTKVIQGLKEQTKRSVYIFEQVLWVCRDFYFSEEMKSEIREAICEGDSRIVQEVLSHVMQELGSKDETSQKFAYYILAQYILEILQEQNCDTKQLASLVKHSFSDKASLESKLIAFFEEQKRQNVYLSIDRVIDYIRENYKDSEFSLDSIAKEFSMSPSGISKYIKENSGKKYTEYISELRIEEACRLLAETNKTIQEITFEVGYSDSVSFSKKFKLLVGVAPGKYRENMKS